MSTSRTFVAGNVLTAAQQNQLGQGQLGYAEKTTSQAGITTVVDITGLSVTFTAVAGRRVRITAACLVQSTVVDDIAALEIKEGAAILQIAQVICRPAANSMTARAEVILTPTAAAHTYKATMRRGGGTGTLTVDAGATFPAFIVAEDIGVT